MPAPPMMALFGLAAAAILGRRRFGPKKKADGENADA
ncbi:MAG: MYXO-CTERM sorting domain-containing protein [Pseudomonadota bacterium]|nr:MYXO-CTERM sorting domain-containing protein [Pseudomonadota bacterium]